MVNKRPIVVAVRLSAEEVALVDQARGPLSRSAWLRWALLDYRKGFKTAKSVND